MNGEAYEIEARWGPREESAASCAARLARMLEALAVLHPAFARWQRPAMTRAEANDPFCAMPPRVEELARIFESGRHRNDERPPKVIADLGFSVSAWNGIDSSHGVSFRANAGAYWRRRRFPNSVTLNPPLCDTANRDLVSLAGLKPVLLAVADAWDPQWAGLGTMHDLPRLEDAQGDYPSVRSGWLTWLSAPYARRILPPPGIRREDLPGGALLLIASEVPYEVANPAHVAAANAIQDALAPLQR